jgi:hypothetical protein
MILTPEEIDRWTQQAGEPSGFGRVADTLAVYADIVQQVAEGEPLTARALNDFKCRYCDRDASWSYRDGAMRPYSKDHDSDCLYLAARKLRGLE